MLMMKRALFRRVVLVTGGERREWDLYLTGEEDGRRVWTAVRRDGAAVAVRERAEPRGRRPWNEQRVLKELGRARERRHDAETVRFLASYLLGSTGR